MNDKQPLIEQVTRAIDSAYWQSTDPWVESVREDELDAIVKASGGLGLMMLDAEVRSRHLDEEVIGGFLSWLGQFPPPLLWELRCLILVSYLTHSSPHVRLEAASSLEWMGCRYAGRYVRRAGDRETLPTTQKVFYRIADAIVLQAGRAAEGGGR